MCQDTESTWKNQWFFYTPIKSTEENHEQTPIHKSQKKNLGDKSNQREERQQ